MESISKEWESPRHIFLIGFMGSGKSSVAEALSKRLGRERMEMDEQIVQQQHMPITEIFDKYGEAYFRNLETRLLRELQHQEAAVISCGGGVPMRQENVDIMKESGRVVLLTARPETIYERVKDSTQRPILNQNMSVEFIEELMEKRSAKYQAAADLVIKTDDKGLDEICSEMIQKLQKAENSERQNF